MQALSRTAVLQMLALALVYFLTGELGLLLAVPPGYATSIWPPSGIALAGVLIFGYRIWPGIVLGSFLVNLQTSFDVSSAEATVLTIALPLVISGGAALQAVAAAFLLRRFAAFPNALANVRDVFSFLFFGGVVGSLVNASLGVLALLASGRIPADNFFFNWSTWWIGDATGVFIFTPLGLTWFLKPSENWLGRRKFMTLSVGLSFLLSTMVVILSSYWEREQINSHFEQHASELTANLKLTLNGYLNVLQTLESFSTASDEITREEFRLFTKPYLENFQGLQALSWDTRLGADERKGFETAMQKQGFPNFKMTERTAGGELIPAADRAEYVCIQFIEPLSDNQAALGYDVYSQETRREALDRARDLGKPVVTGRIQLVQETGAKYSVLALMPVYRHGIPHETVAERRLSLQGFMVGVFKVADVLNAAIERHKEEGIIYQLIDDSAAADQQLLYASKNFPKSGKLVFEEKGLFGSAYQLRQQNSLAFGDRVWEFEVLAGQQFIALHRSGNVWLVLLAGLVLTSLVGALALVISGRDLYLRQMIAERTAALRRSEASLLEAQEIGGIGNWEWDIVNNQLWWSSQIYRIFQINPNAQQLSYEVFLDLIHPDDRELVIKSVDAALYEGKAYDIDHRILLLNGQERIVHERAEIRYDDARQPIRMIGTVQDITARKLAETKLHQAASVFDYANEGILIADPNGIIIDVNDAFSRVTGYAREEVIGQNPRILSSGRQDKDFYAAMWQTLIEQQHWTGEIWNRRKNGEVYAELLTISTVKDDHDNVLRYVAIFSDITSIKEQQQLLEHIAHYDALTGLPNRSLLADRINQAIAQSSRRQENFAVVYLDLDGFKAVNDRYGHDAGDRLLVAVATRMKRALREGDTLARLGGDEFVAVLLNIANFDNCQPLLLRLLGAASEPIDDDGVELHVSASLGVSFYPQTEAIDADQLMRQADQAMYRAKQEGKNRFHLFDSERDRSIRDKRDSLLRLENALVQQEFVLYYQPKVDMASGRIIGVEALIRWQHPQQGILPPGLFLSIVEGQPLMIALGDWVIETAVAQVVAWRKAGIELPVSINIAAQQLEQPDFIDKLRHVLAKYPEFQPGDVELEVLETSALQDMAGISNIIQASKALGVNFALDDFGTGYSSLVYLKHLPAETLKIDQGFVRGMLESADDQAILEGIIGLARAFRRQAIAEGVETQQHIEMLLKLDCQYGQGYAISPPLPAVQIPQWLKDWQSGVSSSAADS